jgi:hypothetical protein
VLGSTSSSRQQAHRLSFSRTQGELTGKEGNIDKRNENQAKTQETKCEPSARMGFFTSTWVILLLETLFGVFLIFGFSALYFKQDQETGEDDDLRNQIKTYCWQACRP